MKISKNFSDKEFLSDKVIKYLNARGLDTRRWINPKLVKLAEFYKYFFLSYYSKINSDIIDVFIIINKRGVQTRGWRSPLDSSSGAKLSLHKTGFAFDCDIVFKFKDGATKECDYKEIHGIINKYEREFMDAGLTTVEDVKIAKTWLHSSTEWRPDEKHIVTITP